jgi:hypothetical protein
MVGPDAIPVKLEKLVRGLFAMTYTPQFVTDLKAWFGGGMGQGSRSLRLKVGGYF